MDPAWAEPYLNLALRYGNLGQARESRRWAAETYRRSRNLENRGRLFVDGIHFGAIYDIDAAVDAWSALRNLDPSGGNSAFNMGGIYLFD